MTNYHIAPLPRGHQNQYHVQPADQTKASSPTPSYSGSNSSRTTDHGYESNGQDSSMISQQRQDRQQVQRECSSALYYPWKNPPSKPSSSNNCASGNFASMSGNKRKPVEGLSETHRRLKRAKLNEYASKTTESKKSTNSHKECYSAPYSPPRNPHQLSTNSQVLYPRERWDSIPTSPFATHPEREIEGFSSMAPNLSYSSPQSYSPPPTKPPQPSMKQEQHPKIRDYKSSSYSPTSTVLEWPGNEDSFDSEGLTGPRNTRVGSVSNSPIICHSGFKLEYTGSWYNKPGESEEKFDSEEDFDSETESDSEASMSLTPTPSSTFDLHKKASSSLRDRLPGQGDVYSFKTISYTRTSHTPPRRFNSLTNDINSFRTISLQKPITPAPNINTSDKNYVSDYESDYDFGYESDDESDKENNRHLKFRSPPPHEPISHFKPIDGLPRLPRSELRDPPSGYRLEPGSQFRGTSIQPGLGSRGFPPVSRGFQQPAPPPLPSLYPNNQPTNQINNQPANHAAFRGPPTPFMDPSPPFGSPLPAIRAFPPPLTAVPPPFTNFPSLFPGPPPSYPSQHLPLPQYLANHPTNQAPWQGPYHPFQPFQPPVPQIPYIPNYPPDLDHDSKHEFN